jgi:class 3 adenylate cyclase/cytochrome b
MQLASDAFERPAAFIAFGYAGLVAALLAAPVISSATQSAAGLAIAGAVALIVAATQLHCFFRKGRIAYPLISAGILLVVGSLLMISAINLIGPASGVNASATVAQSQGERPLLDNALTAGGREERPSTVPVEALIVVGMFVISAAWGGTGILAAIIGSWSVVRREESAVHRLSRQELLARLFDRQSRLAQLARQGRLQRRRTLSAFTSGAYGFWGLSAILGFVGGLVLAAATGWMRTLAADEDGGFWRVAALAGTIIVMALGLVIAGIIGRQANKASKGALGAVVAVGASLFALAVPFPTFGPDYVRGLAGSPVLVGYVLTAAAVAALLGASGQVEGRAQRLRGLRGDDPALLMADIIRIQRRLAPGRKGVCVAVVDVVGSTRIKAKARPLDIEFSFREYQNLAASTSEMYGGEVISTAGDGAVIAYPSAAQAFEGSRQMLRQLGEFNRSVNRLNSDFRIRIGLHQGQTAADLGEAPYNELIDIAAHVEAKAPSNGIALTEQAAKDLQDEALAEIAEEIDGQRVFFALYPLAEKE